MHGIGREGIREKGRKDKREQGRKKKELCLLGFSHTILYLPLATIAVR